MALAAVAVAASVVAVAASVVAAAVVRGNHFAEAAHSPAVAGLRNFRHGQPLLADVRCRLGI